MVQLIRRWACLGLPWRPGQHLPCQGTWDLWSHRRGAVGRRKDGRELLEVLAHQKGLGPRIAPALKKVSHGAQAVAHSLEGSVDDVGRGQVLGG